MMKSVYRRMPALGILLSALLLAVMTQRSDAQCCTAGNPVNTNCDLTANGAQLLNVTWSYMYSQSDAYYRGTQRLDKTYAESNYDFASLALSYAVSERLRLTADLGYYFDKAQRFVQSDYTRYAKGISDATLGLNYTTYSSEDRLFELAQTARVTIPLGEFNQQYDGIVLPIDFQPSSGNYRYNLGLILNKRFEDSDFTLMSYNTVEFSQAIETENTYHKYGNLYLASVMGVYRISAYLQGLLQLRYEIRDRALSGARTGASAGQYNYLNSSGGVIGYISPQLAVNLFSDWMFSVQYNIPFYRNIYGEEQLTNRHSVSVNLSRVFDFGGGAALSEPGLGYGQGNASSSHGDDTISDNLRSVEMNVRGNCEMCAERIESVAASQANVRKAEWEAETETLKLYYRETTPDIQAIGKAIAEAGHDNGENIAPEDVYNDLPACCQYRE